jgi:hypothetical protein
MTEFRLSERCDLYTADVAAERSDTPMDMEMEIATAAISITMETAGVPIFRPMGETRMDTGAEGARPNDWRSCVERMIGEQALGLT